MKKRKIYSNLAKKFASAITVLSIVACGNVFADNKGTKGRGAVPSSHNLIDSENRLGSEEKNKKEHKGPGIYRDFGNGWKISSLGGILYENMNDDRYWFHLSGVLRVDSTAFMGSYRDKQNAITGQPDFANGTIARAAQIYLDGGIGCDFEYTITLNLTNFANIVFNRALIGRGNTATIDPDTWLAYEGIDNAEFFVGYFSGSWFGIDNANGTTWMPFLERGLPALAFYPGDGVGFMADFWNDCSALTLLALQPPQGGTFGGGISSGGIPAINPKATVRDHWTLIARGTFAPVHEKGNVWHFGISGAWKEAITSINGAPFADTINSFSARPSARARFTRPVLDTSDTLITRLDGSRTPLGNMIASDLRYFNVEVARLCGPVLLEAEYTLVNVHGLKAPINSAFFTPGNVNFHGYTVQGSYVLTGESHEYDVRDGNFGSLTPCSPCGAVELAARYDFLNLNDKQIRGGSQHDVTLGVNWYINQTVRLSANYIHATINPPNDNFRRHLDIIAFRAQVRFK